MHAWLVVAVIGHVRDVFLDSKPRHEALGMMQDISRSGFDR